MNIGVFSCVPSTLLITKASLSPSHPYFPHLHSGRIYFLVLLHQELEALEDCHQCIDGWGEFYTAIHPIGHVALDRVVQRVFELSCNRYEALEVAHDVLDIVSRDFSQTDEDLRLYRKFSPSITRYATALASEVQPMLKGHW